MAVGTYTGVISPGRRVTVIRSTGDALGSGQAAILFDTNASKLDVIKALRGCIRSFDRARSRVSKLSNIIVTGTSFE